MLRVVELDHIVLNVADIDRSLAFYVEGLGLETDRLEEYRRGEAPFPSVRLTADTIIDLFPPAMQGAAAPGSGRENLNHFCLVVAEDIPAIQAHLGQIGVAVERGPSRVFGARGYGTSVYVRDPDGNVVELRCYPEEGS